MITGISDKEWQLMLSSFKKIQNLKKVILFGSRAKGNYKKASDIDLVLIGKDLTLKNSVYPLMEDFEELPYFVDILIYEYIKDKDILEHIERVGKVVYER